MVRETITGVTDPYGRTLKITITGIQQNEPVSGGAGPDGGGVGTSIAYVRAQRDGGGTGRLYYISFQASVMNNLSCTGSVEVFVPHDKGQASVPANAGKRVDTGTLYDSTDAAK